MKTESNENKKEKRSLLFDFTDIAKIKLDNDK